MCDDMTQLVFNPYDITDFENNRLDVAYIVELMSDHDYLIDEEDVYLAWLNGGGGVWESPFDYTDPEIVFCIVEECKVIPPVMVDVVNRPFFEEWLDNEVAQYIPKQNAKMEGLLYDTD